MSRTAKIAWVDDKDSELIRIGVATDNGDGEFVDISSRVSVHIDSISELFNCEFINDIYDNHKPGEVFEIDLSAEVVRDY
ncbi:MAG: hypothetical protein GY799_29605 [Desulfobulbaceae bacterium]|nr:hypothetical protein [Desulfobulbaceae bacterium]